MPDHDDSCKLTETQWAAYLKGEVQQEIRRFCQLYRQQVKNHNPLCLQVVAEAMGWAEMDVEDDTDDADDDAVYTFHLSPPYITGFGLLQLAEGEVDHIFSKVPPKQAHQILLFERALHRIQSVLTEASLDLDFCGEYALVAAEAKIALAEQWSAAHRAYMAFAPNNEFPFLRQILFDMRHTLLEASTCSSFYAMQDEDDEDDGDEDGPSFTN